jgi:AcrR family transcriptional regulator
MVNTVGMAKDKRAAQSSRLTAADWIDAACVVIMERGVGAVAVEPLALRLGVTKGSFYWHFANRDALVQAALERWEQVDTEAVIATVAQIDDPRERLRQLMVEAMSYVPTRGGEAGSGFLFGPAFDLAIADAGNDPIVEPILRRVSERRLDYLEQCYRAVGFAPEGARYQALMAYAAYVGTLRLAREAPGRLPRDEEYQAYQRHLIATIMPEDESGPIKQGQTSLPRPETPT